MSVTDSNRWTVPSVASIAAEGAALSGEAKALLMPEHSPRQFVAVLHMQGLGADAVRLIPLCLSRREAVWWAAQCVRAVPELIGDPKCVAAIAAVEKWCANPSEDNRRASLTASETAELSTPAGCVAMAVFFSEGSIAPANVAAVPAPLNIAASMAGNAVLLAAVVKNPEKALEKFSKFVQLADDVATGANLWPGGKPAVAANAVVSATSTGAKSFPPYPQAKR